MQVVAGGVRYVWTHNYPTDTADTAAARRREDGRRRDLDPGRGRGWSHAVTC